MQDNIFFEVKDMIPNVLSFSESLKKFCTDEKSFIRIGDGEYNLIFNNINIFEHKNEKLGNSIYKILNNDNDSINIGIADNFPYSSFNMLVSKNAYLSNWLKSWYVRLKQYMLYMKEHNMNLFSMKKQYLNASIFSPYHSLDSDIIDIGDVFTQIKKVFRNKDIILVTGDPYFKKYKDNENVFNEAKSLEIYETPSKGSFQLYDTFLNDLKKTNGKLICMACAVLVERFLHMNCRRIMA